MTVSTSIAGVILAGGQSRRMGRDKALLSLDNKTLLGHAQDLLDACGFSPVLVCGPRPGELPDRFPGQGPLAGLDSALQHLLPSGINGLLLIPVDMPRLDAPTLLHLAGTGCRRASVAHYRQQPLPLYCPVTLSAATLCEQLLQDKNPRRHALHVFAREAHALAIDADTTNGKMDNINTPDDWQQLLAGRQDLP